MVKEYIYIYIKQIDLNKNKMCKTRHCNLSDNPDLKVLGKEGLTKRINIFTISITSVFLISPKLKKVDMKFQYELPIHADFYSQ